MICKHPLPVAHNDTMQALRDALIVAMVQAHMTRIVGTHADDLANNASEYVKAANRIARQAYPDEA